jgi:WD40 repeat protein
MRVSGPSQIAGIIALASRSLADDTAAKSNPAPNVPPAAAMARVSDWCTAIAYSPDGRLIATGMHSGGVRLWDAVTGDETQILQFSVAPPDWYPHSRAITSLSFAGEGKTLSAGSFGKLIREWDLTTGRQTRSVVGPDGWEHSMSAYDATLKPDQDVVASRDQGDIILWHSTDGTLLRRFWVARFMAGPQEYYGLTYLS